MSDGLERLQFANAAAFERWLAENAASRGAWLTFAKNGRATTLTKAEAVDCALCQGWIDGQLGRLDEDHFLVRFTPRKPGGRWSANNAGRAQELIELGRMLPRGLAEIEAAKADGRWAAAYPSASQSGTPPDFSAALQRNPRAAKAFEALDGANRYAVLYRLHHAKAAVRAARIGEMVEMLARGETFHPLRKPRQRGGSNATRRGLAGNSTPS